MLKIKLYAHQYYNPEIADEWRKVFKNCADVEVIVGDICEAEVDSIVSPANSFGFMNGGLDAQLTNRFGTIVQERIQSNLIKMKRELLVGESMIVKTDDETVPYIISSPTMRLPMIISDTVNVYLATKASLMCAVDNHLGSIAFSAMGVGVGKVSIYNCANQMFKAYEEVILGKWSLPANLAIAGINHKDMIRF